MFSRILVPLDGSERAARALSVAAKVARATHGSLVLTQVLNAPAELLPYIVPGMEPSTLGADLQGVTNYLSSLMTLPETQGIPAAIAPHVGHAPSMILQEARGQGVDLIVLTSHGRTGITRWALGSVAHKVAQHAPMPVLLLRDDAALPVGPHPDATQPLRVLVALDGSSAAEEALGPAVELVVALASPGPAALHLLRVTLPAEDLEPARAYLRDIEARLRAAQPAELTLAITWSVARGEDVAQSIAQAAHSGEPVTGAAPPTRCDLIALTPFGMSGRQEWALGTVAERVLASAKMPLFIVRPTDAGPV